MARNIQICQTDELTSWCESEFGDSDDFKAAENAKMYIEGALDSAGVSHDVWVSETTIDPPIENAFDPFFEDEPCGWENKYYDGVLQYFQDWLNECNLIIADDSNLLLSNTDSSSGGMGFPTGTYAHAQTGQKCALAPDSYPDSRGDRGGPLDGIATALHEVGHNLMEDSSDGQHETGEVIELIGSDSITPMSANYQEQIEDTTYCCTDPENCGEDTSDIGKSETRFSDCTISRID